MKLHKFNQLFNKILFENIDNKDNNNITITYKTFDYHFHSDINTNKIYCFFNSIDKADNKLISIKATIFENNQYEFLVTKNITKKTYTDKEFMLAYYNEYKDFKQALSEYKKQQEENRIEQTNETLNKEIIDGKSIPKIINFNDALSQEQDIEDGILIKTNGIAFTIKQVEDKIYNNLITVSFTFQNENPLKKETDLLTYDVIALVKSTNYYIKILNINLYDPDDLQTSEPILVMNESEFKQKFLTAYFNLRETITNYFNQLKLENHF